MSGKRRKINSEITISLFSFQDIIMCLSGIMIMLVLLMAIDIISVKQVKSTITPLSTIKKLNSLKDGIEIKKKILLKSESKLLDYQTKEIRLKKYLSELKKREQSILNSAKNISFIPAKDANPNQRAVLIECSDNTIRTKVRNFYIDSDGIKEFIQSLANLDKLRDYPVFIIKPSASDYVINLIDEVQNMGFDVGYDAMPENESVQNLNN